MNYIAHGTFFENGSYVKAVKEVFVSDPLYMEQYFRELKRTIIKPVFRFYILNQDETINTDISQWVMSAELNAVYQNGQRRTLNLALLDEGEYFIPHPIQGILWSTTKIRMDAGIIAGDVCFWHRQGVFLVQSVSPSLSVSGRTTTISLVDKFGMFDGTVGGKVSGIYKIYADTPIVEAIQAILCTDQGNGDPFDLKPVIFTEKHKNTKLAYDLTKDYDGTLGDMLKSLADMISCDIYYNTDGNLVITPGADDLACVNRPILWQFTSRDPEMRQESAQYDYNKLITHVTVVGNNINGHLFEAKIGNINPASINNVQLNRMNTKHINDSNIFSDDLAVDRAQYELLKATREFLSKSRSCTYLPHLYENGLVLLPDQTSKVSNQKNLIQSFNMSVSTGEVAMTLSLFDTSDMPFGN